MMEYDQDKVDDLTLALLYLVRWDDRLYGARAWKSFDWDTMDRLFQKDYIDDPRGKAKSVALTPEGVERCEALFRQHFGRHLRLSS